MLRSGRLSLGPMGERFERAFADWLGVEDAVAVSSGTTGPPPRRQGARLGRGRRGPDQPLQLRRLRQLPALRGRAAGLLRRRPGDPQPRPGRGSGGARRADRGHPPGPHLRLPGGDGGARGARRRQRPRRPRGRLRGARRDRRRGPRGRHARQPRDLRLLRQQADDDGGGGDARSRPRREVAARLRSERNQGRAADMGWLDHGGLGFNYRLGDVAAALGVAQVEKLDQLLERARRGRRAVRRGPGRHRGRRAADPRPRAPSGAAGSSTRSGCRPAPTATRRSPASPSAASPARPICPASTSSRTCGSSATARASSRWPKTARRARWRCPSSRR